MKKLYINFALLLSFLFLWQASWADNQYGLKDNIQDGVILHCFDWTVGQIEAEIPNIAKAGFTAVQTSPIHQKEGQSAWYMAYQPYDYAIGNSICADATALTSLCNTAHKYGVKVIVDVVANHTNGSLQYVASYWQNTDLYHNYGSVSNWNDRYQVTHGEIGMKDLKTEDSRVQEKIHSYVETLKSCGVDGIRWDAAKHIGLPSEGDTFWKNVPDQSMFNYGEILDGTGGDDATLLPEYQSYISITDNGYGNGFANSFNSGQVNSSIGNFNQRGASTAKLVYWGESHDTYSNGNEGSSGLCSTYMSQNVIDRAYAIVAGNNGASALYFSRPSATAKSDIKMGVKGSTHFTSKEVAEINHLHNICAGEANYYVHTDDVAAQVRKNGAVIVLGSGSNKSISIANGDGNGWMTTGTYTDKIGGGTFTVGSSTISGTVGSTGIAVIYKEKSSEEDTTNTKKDVYEPSLDNAKEISCFLETSKENVKAWVWDSSNNDANYTGGTWPGESMKLMGKADNGNNIFKWTYTGTLASLPTGVIFTHDDGAKFNDNDGTFTNHGYYTESSATSCIKVIKADSVATDTTATDTTTVDSAIPRLTVENVAYGDDGTANLVVGLVSNIKGGAFAFNITLPDGVEVQKEYGDYKYSLGSLVDESDSKVYFNTDADGSLLLACGPIGNLNDTIGTLVTIPLTITNSTTETYTGIISNITVCKPGGGETKETIGDIADCSFKITYSAPLPTTSAMISSAGTAGINSISVNELVNKGKVYNLQGQKVDKIMQGGVYIVNGKKVVIRK